MMMRPSTHVGELSLYFLPLVLQATGELLHMLVSKSTKPPKLTSNAQQQGYTSQIIEHKLLSYTN
jgi:hypothetical protein